MYKFSDYVLKEDFGTQRKQHDNIAKAIVQAVLTKVPNLPPEQFYSGAKNLGEDAIAKLIIKQNFNTLGRMATTLQSAQDQIPFVKQLRDKIGTDARRTTELGTVTPELIARKLEYLKNHPDVLIKYYEK